VIHHTVVVWGKPYTVHAEQISQTVWRVTGNYGDTTNQTEDCTEAAALQRWQDWAKHKETLTSSG
jgi:hypothetical protein